MQKLTATEIRQKLMAKINELDSHIRAMEDLASELGIDVNSYKPSLYEDAITYRRALKDFYEEIRYK